MANASAVRTSVLIRTIGRPSLVRSVEAALSQTHRPAEIVIVNTRDAALPAADGVHVRVVAAAGANRPRAANIALDNARGDWLIFLDDDDSFAPGHIASLLDAATRSAAGVAYSSTLCVDAEGRGDVVVGAPFDRLHLLHGNFIQIGACLFAARLLSHGLRFDEALECLQDWDFWIQLSRHTHFAYTGESTNLWSAFTGASGAGMGANKRLELTDPFHDRIVRKWAAYADSLRGKVRHHRDAAQSAMSAGRVDAANRHLAAADMAARGPIAQV